MVIFWFLQILYRRFIYQIIINKYNQLNFVWKEKQLSWLMRSGLGFGLAFFKGCKELVAQLQVVLLSESSFPPKHVRAWSVSMQHWCRLKLWNYYALHSHWNQKARGIILLGKELTYFSQSSEWQLGARLVSGFIFEYGNSN